MGTRHWPEDATEAVEKLEAEIDRLKNVLWCPDFGGSKVDKLKHIIYDLDDKHQAALKERNKLQKEVDSLNMQAVQGCEYIGQIEKLEGQFADAVEVAEAWKFTTLDLEDYVVDHRTRCVRDYKKKICTCGLWDVFRDIAAAKELEGEDWWKAKKK